MGLPAYLVTNQLSGASITSSTEDSLYPLENLYDEILANPFKWTVTTGGWIEVDLGVSASWDTVAILGHNFVSGATFTIKGGASPNPSTSLATPAFRAGGILAALSTLTHRYVRITVTETNTEASEVGELVIGTRVALPRSFRFGYAGGVQQSNLEVETERGVRWTYKQFQREIREYDWRLDGTSELANFRTLHDAVLGNLTPFVWIPDVAGTDVYYVRKEPGFAYVELDNRGSAFDYHMTLTEETDGTVVSA